MNQLFERLLAFTHDGVYRYRFVDGVVLMANEGFIRILDLPGTSDDVVGRPLKDLMVYTEREGTVREAIACRGEIHGFEYHFRTLSGQDRWVVHDSFATIDPESGERIVDAIVRDVTERKKTELELRNLNEELELRIRHRTRDLEIANHELEAFAYSVSHDLRAPLLSIDGFSKLLVDEFDSKLDDTARDYLRRIRDCTQQLGHLIDQLLKLSRLSRADMQREEVDLSDVAAQICSDLMRSHPERDAVFEIQPGLTVEGDSALLKTVLYNLIGNAWKFTGKQPSARIQVGSVAHDGRHAFYVKDNGVGFDMKYSEKLFNAFQRLHGSAEFPGTGIGLVSVQRALARHGGRIWARAEVGQGATFYFTLHDPASANHEGR